MLSYRSLSHNPTPLYFAGSAQHCGKKNPRYLNLCASTSIKGAIMVLSGLSLYYADFLARQELKRKAKLMRKTIWLSGLAYWFWDSNFVVEATWKRALRKIAYRLYPIGRNGLPTYFGRYEVPNNFFDFTGTHVIMEIWKEGEGDNFLFHFNKDAPTNAVIHLYEPEYFPAALRIKARMEQIYSISVRLEEMSDHAPKFVYPHYD